MKNKTASWISPLAQTSYISGTDTIHFCPYLQESNKLIFVSHFELDADATITWEAVIDNVGQVRLWKDADPTQEVYISAKNPYANGTIILKKDFYSIVMDGIDTGGGATGTIATIFNADGSIIQQTKNSKDWCIFRVAAATDVASFVKSASSCRYCLIGEAAD